ncbi:hypothetical protein [Neobacillus vireti]|uniref:Uncharacterized protein n=1 Tax=Neobacillus vireti LMG 21834 TaxID=1131730 RepID=A0AB94ILN1_9BACI|nr:hypothetical protein [Neobacillus vireti]ETI67873.1 hypothetical protein BAVI_15331 [Neobacillus vireti LMG 21834]KLT17300.1 hypothetical protein AA980_15595 [Neobacillus vireti]
MSKKIGFILFLVIGLIFSFKANGINFNDNTQPYFKMKAFENAAKHPENINREKADLLYKARFGTPYERMKELENYKKQWSMSGRPNL